MDIQEFLKEALVQIAAGASGASEEVRKSGGAVNPAITGRGTPHPLADYVGTMSNGQNVWLVEFDIAATVTESHEIGSKGKISVASIFELKAGGAKSASEETTSRIRFKVPLALPVDAETAAERKRKRDNRSEQIRAHNSQSNFVRDR